MWAARLAQRNRVQRGDHGSWSPYHAHNRTTTVPVGTGFDGEGQCKAHAGEIAGDENKLNDYGNTTLKRVPESE